LDIQPGSLSLFEFKLIDKNKREYKLRATNQQDFGAWVKAFQAALARRQRAANKTIKVWFMDISKISIVIERGVTTAEDVRKATVFQFDPPFQLDAVFLTLLSLVSPKLALVACLRGTQFIRRLEGCFLYLDYGR
jgi:hypothetical protein